MNNRALVAALLALTFFRAHAQPAGLPPLPPPPAAAIPAAPAPPPLTLGAQFSDGIRIQDFARVVLKDVLKAQFVFSYAFLSDASYVGFSASSLKKSGSESLLRDVLGQHGFALQFRDGYYRIDRVKPEDEPDSRKDFVYRLKHRDLAYISSLVQPLFGDGSFTFKRSIHSGSAGSEGTTQGAQSDGARPVDNGRSLYSMSDNASADLLIFRGLQPDIDRLKALLDQLDVPVPKVLVRAVIMETRNLEQSGYSVSGVAKMLSGKLGLTIDGSILGNALTFSSGNFDAVLSALQGDSSVRVITAPSVFAEAGASASLSVGASVPTLGAIQFDGEGRSQQSVSYQDTGVILRVVPRILDDSISLSVEQEISDAVQTQTGVAGSPTITKSNIKTSFNLKSGDSVILGGLSAEKSAVARDSLPFWRRITVGNTSSDSSSDIVIILYVEKA